MSDSLWPQGLQPGRLLLPWHFLGKNTGVGCCHFLFGHLPDPGIEPTSSASPALAGGFFTPELPWKPCIGIPHSIVSFINCSICGNLASSKSRNAIVFPTAFAHFVSLYHILVIPAILLTFSLSLCLLWVMCDVILDLNTMTCWRLRGWLVLFRNGEVILLRFVHGF